MTQPRLPHNIPAGIKITGSQWQERAFPPDISDGLATRWPGPPYRISDPRVYQIKIAQDWAERDGSAQPDTMYYLDKLPDGYGCFEMDQPAGKQVYKRLFGHPSGRFYDSILRFETHVWWLLDGKKGLCECFLCGNFKAQPGPPKGRSKVDSVDRSLSTSTSAVRREGPARPRTQLPDDSHSSRSTSVGGMPIDRVRRPARGIAAAYPVDEEGTRNIWKEGMAKIHTSRDSRRGLEIDIREDDSTDWLAEREIIPQYFTQVEQQHSFIPRIGELVLWCPSFPEELFLQRDPTSGQSRFYDTRSKRFIEYFPPWRGGIITAVPSRAAKNGAIDFSDLLNLPEKQTALNTSGFRVETMPDPNNPNKSLSKQYKYVPLRNIRPLSQWQLLLSGIPQKELHASILYALTCMTSVSLIEKWRLNGDWKDGAYISAKGIHLGSELLTVGDVVRLVPQPLGTECTDVMVIDTIRLHLKDLREEHIDLESARVCSRSTVTLLGRAYTTRLDRAWTSMTDPTQRSGVPVSAEDVKSIFRPVGTALYGSWYLLHGTNEKLEVSYDQVLGRLYEAEAIRLWSGQRQQKSSNAEMTLAEPDLGFDMAGIIAGRKYATKVDERVQGPSVIEPNEIRWILSDYRAQALDVATFNGIEVGPWFEARTQATLAAWRAHIKISNGEKVTPEELISATGPRVKKRPSYLIPPLDEFSSQSTISGKRRGRPPGSKLINGKIYRAEDLAKMTDIPLSNTPTKGTGMMNTQDQTEGEEEEWTDEEHMEIAETQIQTPHKHSSQMAGAAMGSSDEDIEEESGEDDEGTEPTEVYRRPLPSKSLLAAYGGADDDTDEELDDDNAYLSAWKQIAVNSPEPRKSPVVKHPRQPQPISKSQIMESVEQGHGSTLASVADQEYDDDDDSDQTEDDLKETSIGRVEKSSQRSRWHRRK